MEEMYAALPICTCAEKTTFLGKDDSTIVDCGNVIMGLRTIFLLAGLSYKVYSMLKHMFNVQIVHEYVLRQVVKIVKKLRLT